MEAVVVSLAGTALLGLGVQLYKLNGQVSRIETIVTRELERNGGESLRDRVVRIESQLHAISINQGDP